jgi:hypothetical protein
MARVERAGLVVDGWACGHEDCVFCYEDYEDETVDAAPEIDLYQLADDAAVHHDEHDYEWEDYSASVEYLESAVAQSLSSYALDKKYGNVVNAKIALQNVYIFLNLLYGKV